MKVVALLFLSSLVLSVTARGRGYGGAIPTSRCFVKKTKCCYEFSSCGYQVKHEPVREPCPYRKCENVCSEKCEYVEKTKYEKKCEFVKVEKPCERKKRRSIAWEGKITRERGWGRKCRPTYEKKRVCHSVPVKFTVPSCRNVCDEVCRKVKAVCKKVYVYKYRKFCPTLVCKRGEIVGDSTKPQVDVSKKGELVEVIKGERIEKERGGRRRKREQKW